MKNECAVYILTNYGETTFYVGVTSNLEQRIYEHKNKLFSGSFSAKYNLTKLVHCELFDSIDEANNREKQLKRWHRQWKIDLIKKNNPELLDLSEDW